MSSRAAAIVNLNMPLSPTTVSPVTMGNTAAAPSPIKGSTAASSEANKNKKKHPSHAKKQNKRAKDSSVKTLSGMNKTLGSAQGANNNVHERWRQLLQQLEVPTIPQRKNPPKRRRKRGKQKPQAPIVITTQSTGLSDNLSITTTATVTETTAPSTTTTTTEAPQTTAAALNALHSIKGPR